MSYSRDDQQEPSREGQENNSQLPQDDSEVSNVSRNNEGSQDGDDSSNYQSREVSSGNEENFYQNRERGNYTEGQQSDEGGGGSLY